eukprot:TRINITY_DN5722_c0_g1_i2.p1 TRINITY_DN5722_c0_g1~~TRINITY_DN5722_c0_g1_i2.p1  ORF type:complete len:257 (-),score=27.56 TRINITY_DN5722_c0_g1_i2:133-903(-)
MTRQGPPCKVLHICYLKLGRFEDAKTWFMKGLDCKLSIHGENEQVVESIMDLLHVLQETQEHDQVITRGELLLRICLATYGDDHKLTADALDMMGRAHHKKGESAKALELLQQALQIRLKVSGEESMDTVHSYVHVSKVQRELRETQQAVDLLLKALTISTKVVGEEDTVTLDILTDLGVTLGDKNKVVAPQSLITLAAVYRKVNNKEKALELYEQAYEALKDTLPDDHEEKKILVQAIAEIKTEQSDVLKKRSMQ